jgi:hypothetical protein
MGVNVGGKGERKWKMENGKWKMDQEMMSGL